MGDRHGREKPLDALEQIFPQRHFQPSMKETARRDKPGLFTNGDWRRQSDARTALSASRFPVAACRQTAAFLQHIEACGALPGIRCTVLLAKMTLKWQADRFKMRTWTRANNRLYHLKK
jgi:hypothetical protein